VITKDYDFRNSFFVNGSPKKLIKVNLGNISTTDLIESISQILNAIEKLATSSSFLVEIDKNLITYTTEKDREL